MHVVFEKEKNDRYFCKGLKKKKKKNTKKTFLVIIFQIMYHIFSN